MADDDLRPTLADVGALLRARTVSDALHGGSEQGTFTANTRPTGGEVDDLITQALAEVDLRLPADLPDDMPERLNLYATRLVALQTAMLVELSYFPDQIAAGASPYEQYKELFDSGLTRLTDAIGDISDAGGVARSHSAPVLSPTAVAAQAAYEGMPYTVWGALDPGSLLP